MRAVAPNEETFAESLGRVKKRVKIKSRQKDVQIKLTGWMCIPTLRLGERGVRKREGVKE